jgi:hypothetical protein
MTAKGVGWGQVVADLWLGSHPDESGSRDSEPARFQPKNGTVQGPSVGRISEYSSLRKVWRYYWRMFGEKSAGIYPSRSANGRAGFRLRSCGSALFFSAR